MQKKDTGESVKHEAMPQDPKMDKKEMPKHEMDPRKEMKSMNGMPMHTDPAHHIKQILKGK